MEKYGAVCIGSQYTHGAGFEWKADGTWGRTKTPVEMGLPLKTREDAIRAFAGLAPRGNNFKVDEIHPSVRGQRYGQSLQSATGRCWRSGGVESAAPTSEKNRADG